MYTSQIKYLIDITKKINNRNNDKLIEENHQG
mgnify:CR=1 FL=1